MSRPIFSGHESFQCKTHWLKRGYDFIAQGNNFNDDDAVVKLGVGKNMVSSIKYWMKSFGMLNQNNQLTRIAYILLEDKNGRDPFFEDIGSLWLMHYKLVDEDYATIYKKTFIDFHRQRNEIDKIKLHNFIKRICFDSEYQNLYNENTVRRDINVLLHNYCDSSSNIEDSNSLLQPLNLIKQIEKDEYCFNYTSQNKVPYDIFLYALVSRKESNSISFDLLQELALIFCLTNNDLVDIVKQICFKYPTSIVFSDVAGIKELQFKRDFSQEEILDNYYR